MAGVVERPAKRISSRLAPGLRDRIAAYPYVLPAVVVVLLVMTYPFCYAIWLSLQSTPSYSVESQFAGLQNYVKILTDALFGRTLLNTVIWTLASTAAGIVLGMVAALLVQQVRFLRGPVRAVLMLPYIVGYVIASYAWLWLYQGEYGLINVALTSWGITSQPISFLSSLTWAFPAVILVNVWKTFPFAMIMLLAGLQGVPEQTVLAARLDRASYWSIFWEVKLPHLRRVLLVTVLLLSFQNFNTFTIPFIMTGGGPLNRTEIVSNLIYNTAFTNLNFGLAAAASTVVMAILGVFAVFYVRSLAREQGGL